MSLQAIPMLSLIAASCKYVVPILSLLCDMQASILVFSRSRKMSFVLHSKLTVRTVSVHYFSNRLI